MRVYFLSYNFYRKTPSTRYRGTYVLEALQKIPGITTSQYNRSQGFLWLLFIYLRIIFSKERHVVIFQRIVHRCKISWLMLRIRNVAKISFMDIDDAIEDLTDDPLDKTYIFDWISSTDGVFVGSSELVNTYQKYNKNVWLLTTPVPAPGQPKKPVMNQPPIIGWIGNYKPHKNNLELFFSAIEDSDLKCTLHLVGITDKSIQEKILSRFQNHSIRVIFPDVKNWESETQINAQIQAFDVGILPQLDTRYDRAKSAFKLKQYLVNGVPGLASPIGETTQVLVHGINGFLCPTPEDWVPMIKKIIQMSPKKYEALCQKTLAKSELADYNMTRYANHLATLLAEQLIIKTAETSL